MVETINGKDYYLVRCMTNEEWDAFVAANKEQWEKVGAEIYNVRKLLRVTKKELAKQAGICVKTLNKLEQGLYIRRFKTVSRSCLNALQKLHLKNIVALDKIED